jgi:hypothetical protein
MLQPPDDVRQRSAERIHALVHDRAAIAAMFFAFAAAAAAYIAGLCLLDSRAGAFVLVAFLPATLAFGFWLHGLYAYRPRTLTTLRAAIFLSPAFAIVAAGVRVVFARVPRGDAQRVPIDAVVEVIVALASAIAALVALRRSSLPGGIQAPAYLPLDADLRRSNILPARDVNDDGTPWRPSRYEAIERAPGWFLAGAAVLIGPIFNAVFIAFAAMLDRVTTPVLPIVGIALLLTYIAYCSQASSRFVAAPSEATRATLRHSYFAGFAVNTIAMLATSASIYAALGNWEFAGAPLLIGGLADLAILYALRRLNRQDLSELLRW